MKFSDTQTNLINIQKQLSPDDLISLKIFDKEDQNGLTIRQRQNWFAASAIQAEKRNLFYV
jgi:hypothetical protein